MVKVRAFWLISFVLALSAIVLRISALREASRGVGYFARAIEGPESQKQESKAEAKRFGKRADALAMSGLVTATIGLIALFVSYRKEESAPRSVAVVLLAFYALLQLAVV